MIKTLGTKIKKIRELKEIDQDFLARSIGITQSYMSRIENGTANLKDDLLEKIAEKLGISVEDILSFNEKALFQNCHSGNFGILNTQNYYLSENERKLYEDLLKAKDEIIKSLKEVIQTYQQKN